MSIVHFFFYDNAFLKCIVLVERSTNIFHIRVEPVLRRRKEDIVGRKKEREKKKKEEQVNTTNERNA